MFVYLEAPLVAELPVQVQVHFHHQQPVPGPGEARGAAPVGGGHVAGSVEVAEVVVSCGGRESGRVRDPANGETWGPTCYLFSRLQM